MAPLDKLKKKPAAQVTVAMMRMKPMRHENMMSEDSYEECQKCAKYQMLIGEALAYYMQHKEDSEEKPDTSELEDEIESEMDSEKA